MTEAIYYGSCAIIQSKARETANHVTIDSTSFDNNSINDALMFLSMYTIQQTDVTETDVTGPKGTQTYCSIHSLSTWLKTNWIQEKDDSRGIG